MHYLHYGGESAESAESAKQKNESANFYIGGMACRAMDERRKGGIQSRRTTKKEEPKKEKTEKGTWERKTAWRMWGNAKRKRNGIIYLTRNNDGLSRWRDKSAQSLFHLLSLEGVGLVSAEDEDLTVMEDESTPVSSLKGRGETTANPKERALSALHVRFDEVGLKGAERSPDGTGESPWPLRLRGHNTKFEPFQSLTQAIKIT